MATYTVKKGDTLSEIAQSLGTTVKNLVNLNKDKYQGLASNTDFICEGWTLTTSGSAASANSPTPASMSKAVITTLKPITTDPGQLYVGWDFDKTDIDHYEVRWYRSWDNQGIAPYEDQSVTTKFSIYNVPDEVVSSPSGVVTVMIKPIAKTVNNVVKWTVDWSDKKSYYFKDNPPDVPPTPSVTIENSQMTITVTGLDDLITGTNSLEFEIVKNNSTSYIEGPVSIKYASVTHKVSVQAGCEYKVRARAVKADGQKSDWSAYSGESGTAPPTPGGLKVEGNSSTSVKLSWSAANTADTYDLEYSTKKEYLGSSNESQTTTGIEGTTYILTGLEGGEEYFFRVRAVNGDGESSWSSSKSVIIGKKPSPPTTWSSTTTAIVGDPLILYWVHNSEDGSKQVTAQLELDINGTVTTHTIKAPETEEDEEEKTSSYEFNTSSYPEGTKVKWRVKTRGITSEYSDWSIQRVVDIYARPTLLLLATDMEGIQVTELTSFPFMITGTPGPNTQTPIGYHVSITANESYETVDHLGNKTIVNQNGEIYSKYFDINTWLSVTLSASDLDLANNITYTIKCTVTMDSGLTAEESTNFTVTWEETVWPPNAEIGIREDSYTSIINPYCVDGYDDLVEGVTLSVYRKEFDGGYKEIASNMTNDRSTFVVDPHPSLDYMRYRIVARDESTGAINYTDVVVPSTIEPAVIIQWDEDWNSFASTEYGLADEHSWSGSLLKLPYNIDTEYKTKPDVVLVEYIGRQNPVGYYGTQIGETNSVNVDIDAKDQETIYQLRRLQRYMGNVYYREPSGVGYWANISISFGKTHKKVTIPVNLDITRVEGGV